LDSLQKLEEKKKDKLAQLQSFKTKKTADYEKLYLKFEV
jgi:hypothetical protein